MRLKKNINLWEITYIKLENDIMLKEIFNSGMIDDIEIIRKYFLEKNPTLFRFDIKKLNNINLKNEK